MTNTLQVANSFVVQYFERLATNPAELASFYGPHATLTINDIEMGIIEANGEDVPFTLQRWAAILQNSKLRVESVNSAALYSGVNVFVTFTANGGALQQHFQSTITLQTYPSGFSAEGYYIRHQVISRIGVLTHDTVDAEEASQSATNEQPVQNDDNESVHDSADDDEHDGHRKHLHNEEEDNYDENDENEDDMAATSSRQAQSQTPDKKRAAGTETDAHKPLKSVKTLDNHDNNDDDGHDGNGNEDEDDDDNDNDEANAHDQTVNRESTSQSASNATIVKKDGKHEASRKDDEVNEREKLSSVEQEKQTKIKSWASLASTAAHKNAAPTRVVRVVASETATRKEDDNKPRTAHTSSANTTATASAAGVTANNNSSAANNTNNNVHAKHHNKENNKESSKDGSAHNPASSSSATNRPTNNTANLNTTLVANATHQNSAINGTASAGTGTGTAANKNNAAR